MSNKFVFFLKESWLLMVSSVFFGVILAITQARWQPQIEQNKVALFNRQAGQLLPEAADFEILSEAIFIQTGQGEPVKADVRRGLKDGQTAGWILIVEGSGYADKITMIAAVDAGFETMKGFRVLSSNETPGFGDKIKIKDGFYPSQYQGAPVGEFSLVKVGDAKKIDSEIVAITGATITSQAVVDIMNAYVVPIKKQLAEKGMLTAKN